MDARLLDRSASRAAGWFILTAGVPIALALTVLSFTVMECHGDECGPNTPLMASSAGALGLSLGFGIYFVTRDDAVELELRPAAHAAAD